MARYVLFHQDWFLSGKFVRTAIFILPVAWAHHYVSISLWSSVVLTDVLLESSNLFIYLARQSLAWSQQGF